MTTKRTIGCAAWLRLSAKTAVCRNRAKYRAVNRRSVPVSIMDVCGSHAPRYMGLGWDIEELPT